MRFLVYLFSTFRPPFVSVCHRCDISTFLSDCISSRLLPYLPFQKPHSLLSLLSIKDFLFFVHNPAILQQLCNVTNIFPERTAFQYHRCLTFTKYQVEAYPNIKLANITKCNHQKHRYLLNTEESKWSLLLKG